MTKGANVKDEPELDARRWQDNSVDSWYFLDLSLFREEPDETLAHAAWFCMCYFKPVDTAYLTSMFYIRKKHTVSF